MLRKLFAILLVASVCLAASGPARAELEWNDAGTFPMKENVLDVAYADNGSRVFVLLAGGEVQILSVQGKLLDRLTVAKDAEQMQVAPKGDQLLVVSGGGREVKLVDLAYVHDLPIGASTILGPENAPITIVEFSDFQCPYCAKAVPLVKQVMDAYPGKVRVVFKQFPLRMHKFAKPAAIASLAAREQGKFWEMHDKLFENFNKLNDAKIKAIAEEIGLDMGAFEKAMKNPAYNQEVLQDMQLGQKVGVRGTPTVFVNGRLVQQRSLPGFKEVIDKELAKLK